MERVALALKPNEIMKGVEGVQVDARAPTDEASKCTRHRDMASLDRQTGR